MPFACNTRPRTPLVAVLVLALGLSANLGQVAAQGLVKFNPETYKGKAGKITVPYRGESMLYEIKFNKRKNPTLTRFVTKNGTFTVPARKHEFKDYYAIVRSGGRLRWSALSSLYYGKLSKVTVKPGGSVAMNVGPPCAASIKVEQPDRKHVYMSLDLVGRGGEDVQIQRHDAAIKKPGFQVLSSKGKVLTQGSFEYG